MEENNIIAMNEQEVEQGNGVLMVLAQDSDLNYDVVLAIMRSGINRNNWDYQNVEQYASTFAGTPILCAYLPNGTVGDGHNMRERRDANGEEYYDFTAADAERIVGTISENPADIWTVERDGNTWVYAKGKLWRFYNRQLVDKIAQQGRMEVSAETEVFESYTAENGVEVFTNFRGLGVTVLGDNVAPAIPGAHIEGIKAMSEKFKEMKLKAASYHPETEPDSEAQKPQNKNLMKGMRKLELFNKQQLDALQGRFEGYHVVCAARDENGIHVALRDNGWSFFTYDMTAENETIAPERIAPCAASVDFGNGCVTDAFAMMAAIAAELVTANTALEAAREVVTARDTEIATMREIESKRRVQTAKSVAAATLAAFNATREDKISDDVIASVVSDIESGVYTNSVNADGLWIGDAEVEDKVYALCGRKVREMAEATAAKNATAHVWDKVGAGAPAADDGSISGLLARKNIRE